MFTEDLTEQVDGVQTAFVTEVSFVAGTLRVYIDGIRQAAGASSDFQELTMGGGPDVPSTGFVMAGAVEVGSTLLADYEIVSDGLLTASGS